MALPVVSLASGLGAFFTAAFGSFAGWLSAFLSQKSAAAVALGVFLIAGWVTLQATIVALWAGLQWAIPGEMDVPLALVGSLMPSNAGSCFSVVIGAKIARWLWDVQAEWAVSVAIA